MNKTTQKRIIDQVRKLGLARPRDLPSVSRHQLTQLCEEGLLQRVARGLYSIANLEVTENHDLALIGRLVPRATICLVSALRYHGLTTQMPPVVWIAIANKDRAPDLSYPALEVVRMSGDSLIDGMKECRIEGVPVRVFDPAKTVADCFKFRNRIGLDVALEALREFRRQHRGKTDLLWTYAGVCRVQSVIRPYLEALD